MSKPHSGIAVRGCSCAGCEHRRTRNAEQKRRARIDPNSRAYTNMRQRDRYRARCSQVAMHHANYATPDGHLVVTLDPPPAGTGRYRHVIVNPLSGERPPRFDRPVEVPGITAPVFDPLDYALHSPERQAWIREDKADEWDDCQPWGPSFYGEHPEC